MNELISIFIIFPSLDCRVLMTHAEGSPYGIVLISSWNQVDLFKMFSCKSLEKKLAVIWVSKQSELFSRTHTEIILDLLTRASSFDGLGSCMFSDTKKKTYNLGHFVQKKSCVHFAQAQETLLKRQARIQLGPKCVGAKWRKEENVSCSSSYSENLFWGHWIFDFIVTLLVHSS